MEDVQPEGEVAEQDVAFSDVQDSVVPVVQLYGFGLAVKLVIKTDSPSHDVVNE